MQPTCAAPPLLQTWLPDGTPWMTCFRRKNGYVIRFQDLVDFEIGDGGTEITVCAVPGTPSVTIEHLYQNQALPLALSLQKALVLHGSAIEIDDRAVAFVAASRRGKSTLAANFSTRGFRFISDDSLVLAFENGRHAVRPGQSSIRLWDDSLRAVAASLKETPRLTDLTSKARLLADENLPFCPEVRPLSRIYFLGDGSATSVSIDPLSGPDAVVETLRHCFLLGIDEREVLANNFRQIAELSRLSVCFSLDYPRRFDCLGEVRAAVIAHCRLGRQSGHSP